MGLTKEEVTYLEQKEEENRMLVAQNQNSQITQSQQAMASQEQDPNSLIVQLDLSNELKVIENLLRGNILKIDEQGIERWEEPTNQDLIILSDYGIHLIMNTISFYINKNTLLSNYDDETINKKMEDFSCDLADTIFMEYEKVFQYPSFQDCKDVLLARIEKKKELKKFALELVDKEVNEDEIEKELIDELEGKVDKEIQKIKEQIIKDKLKRYMILIRTVQDAIHSTYLRAWKGQERTTLRQHIHISESRGGGTIQQPQSKMNPLNWINGR